MGRYYSGDIEGRFWFGLQDSQDASFFGGELSEPRELEFTFDRDNDLATVKEGIKKCTKQLGEYKEQLDSFFEKQDCYNDEMIAEALKVDKERVSLLLEWYARLELGSKILKCLDEQEYCQFTAEL